MSPPDLSESQRVAEATVERIAPGYLARVRQAAAALAVGARRGPGLEPLLAGVAETATIDVDAPVLSRQPALRSVKTTVKALSGWYLSYVGQQVTAFGQAVSTFGAGVVDSLAQLEAGQAAAARQIEVLEARLARLEAKERGQ